MKQYPDMVGQELLNYDKAVCQLFMVDRNHPVSWFCKGLGGGLCSWLLWLKGCTFYNITTWAMLHMFIKFRFFKSMSLIMDVLANFW